MGEQPVGGLLVRYSLPAIAGFLASALYQFADRIIIGRGVGTDGMAAVTAAFPLSIVGMAVALLLGTGTGNRISVLLGQKDQEGAERILGQSVRLGLIAGSVLALVICVFTRPILIACGCEVRLLLLAMPFTRILAVGQIFLIVLIAMGNILRVQGRPMLGLGFMLGSNVLNVCLALAAVYWLHLGVTGTALATALSQVIGCSLVMGFVQSRGSVLHVRRSYLRADRGMARAIVTLGAPFGLMQILATLVFLAANHGAGSQAGSRGLATLGVLNTVAMLLIYPSLGVMQAMMPLVGFNKGAGRLDRVRALLVRVLVTSLGMGAFFAIMIAIFSGPVAALFSKSDPELIAMVRLGLPWFVVPITLFGLAGTMAHYFLSVHEPRKAGVLLLGRQLLAIPLFLLLPHLFGYYGMYLAAPLADLPFAAVGGVFMVRELARLKTAIADQAKAQAKAAGAAAVAPALPRATTSQEAAT
jgi:putative MATE family efflux protein